MTRNNPTIINSKDYKDRNGLLGKAILNVDDYTTVLEISEYSKSVTININLVNTNEDAAVVSIWISDNSIPDLIDIYESKLILESSAVYNRNNIILSSGEKIIALSNIDNVVMRIDGYDNRTL